MILAKNMDMPISCLDCPISQISSEEYWCEILKDKVPRTCENRPNNCPLIEVQLETIMVRTGHTTWEKRQYIFGI